MKKIFIHHDGAIGDILLSLPAICQIKQENAHIHLAGRADVVALLIDSGCINEGSAVDDPRYLSLYGDLPSPELRAFLSSFDSSVVFAGRPDAMAARGIGALIPDRRVVLTVPPDGSGIHVSDYRLSQLGGRTPASGPVIRPSPRHTEVAGKFLADAGRDVRRPLVAVHPGSGGSRKRWPLDSYLSMLSLIDNGKSPHLLLISGPAEDDTTVRVLAGFARANPAAATHLANCDLSSLAAFLSMSDLYIGNDSGISHLAGVLDVRSIVLFGPTDPVLWRPLGKGVTVLSGGLPCSPCGDQLSRECRDRRCLAGIAPDTVAAAVLEALAGSSR